MPLATCYFSLFTPMKWAIFDNCLITNNFQVSTNNFLFRKLLVDFL